MCVSCLTVVWLLHVNVPLLTLERKLPSHRNDFQTCGVHGPGASLPTVPYKSKSLHRSKGPGASAVFTVCGIWEWITHTEPEMTQRANSREQEELLACLHMDKGQPDLQGFSFISTRHRANTIIILDVLHSLLLCLCDSLPPLLLVTVPSRPFGGFSISVICSLNSSLILNREICGEAPEKWLKGAFHPPLFCWDW